MNWITKVPGWPILGNALEFGETTGKKYIVFNFFSCSKVSDNLN